jgi:hypothetical protein
LRIIDVSEADEGVYECRVSPARGHQALRSAALIEVIALPEHLYSSTDSSVYGAELEEYPLSSTDVHTYETTEQARPVAIATQNGISSTEAVQPLHSLPATNVTVDKTHPESISTERVGTVTEAFQPVPLSTTTHVEGLEYDLLEPTPQYPALSSTASVSKKSVALMNGGLLVLRLLWTSFVFVYCEIHLW